jgi:signal transduction histidine kinase
VRDGLLDLGRKQIGEARWTGQELTERALRMHCVAYLADVKARLLTEVIVDMKSSKDALADGLSEEQASRAKLDELVSRRSAELERAESRLRQEERTQALLQSQLIQAERMRAAGALAGGVAHDLKNYLFVIGCFLDQLDSPDADSVVEPAEARDALAGASRLTAQLLDLSRKPALNTRRGSLNEVVSRAAQLLQPSLPGKVRLRLALDVSDPKALLDEAEVLRATLNLCLNARDALAERAGFITLATGTRQVNEPPASATPGATAGRYAWLRVADSGPGIAANDLPRVFEPFFTTKEPGHGTGLGLSLVFTCMQAHGGWVEVESQEGVGTAFQLYFPAAPPDGAGS